VARHFHELPDQAPSTKGRYFGAATRWPATLPMVSGSWRRSVQGGRLPPEIGWRHLLPRPVSRPPPRQGRGVAVRRQGMLAAYVALPETAVVKLAHSLTSKRRQTLP